MLTIAAMMIGMPMFAVLTFRLPEMILQKDTNRNNMQNKQIE